MKKINLFAILFAIASVLFFAGCDNDNDKKDGDVNPPAEDCFCDEAKTVACPDGIKDACDKPAPTCDPACNAEAEDCICAEDKCECRAKDVPADDLCKDKEAGADCAEGKVCTAGEDGKLACMDKPASARICDPACDAEKQDCICEADKCECKDKNAQIEECFCDEAKTVKCPEGGKEACTADPSAPADACQDKAENDACGENKTCQKGEGDKLECKDKPADAPAE